MPRKAMKVVVELDIHTVTCPGTFLRDYGYVYLKVNCMGLEVNTKSVAPTFPLFFHERLRFERVFKSCQDPAYVTVHLKGEDVLVELRQHDDYISDGYVIGHYANNARDFLYPAVPPYPGSGREATLFKTSLFNPIRITGQPLRLEFSTKTTIKEVPDPTDYLSSDSGVDDVLTNSTFTTSQQSISPTGSKQVSRSPSRHAANSPVHRYLDLMILLQLTINHFLFVIRTRVCWKIVTLVLLLVLSLGDQDPSHQPGGRAHPHHPD